MSSETQERRSENRDNQIPRWVHIARKDFEDAIRSRLLWGIIVLFTLFAAGGSYAITFIPVEWGIRGAVLTSDTAIAVLQGTAGWAVPIIAAFVGFASIVGERESGSLRILISLPASRFDVVIGKVLGRVSIVFVSIVTGFGISLIVILLTYDKFLPLNFFFFTVLTALLGLAFTSIAVSISAAFKSRNKALGGIVGFMAFVLFIWDFVPLLLLFITTGTPPIPGENYPAWYAFLERVFPNGAYASVANQMMDLGEISEQTQLQNLLTGTESVPFYLSEWFMILILLFWITVPPFLGYLRFRDADLS